MSLKDLILFFIIFNIMVGSIGALGVFDYEITESPDYAEITNESFFNETMGEETVISDDTEQSTWEIISQTKTILHYIYRALFGFPWLLNLAFGGRSGSSPTAVGVISAGLTGVMLFMYGWLIMEFVRGFSKD